MIIKQFLFCVTGYAEGFRKEYVNEEIMEVDLNLEIVGFICVVRVDSVILTVCLRCFTDNCVCHYSCYDCGSQQQVFEKSHLLVYRKRMIIYLIHTSLASVGNSLYNRSTFAGVNVII